MTLWEGSTFITEHHSQCRVPLRTNICLYTSSGLTSGLHCTGYANCSFPWDGFTLILSVPLSAQFCLGWWDLGRSSWAAGQDGGTPKSKSTQRCMSRWNTLYLDTNMHHSPHVPRPVVRHAHVIWVEGLAEKVLSDLRQLLPLRFAIAEWIFFVLGEGT